MRKNPWHLRIPSTEHYQWFRNLVDLHRLTEAWRLETLTQNLKSNIELHLGRKVQESLWMLDNLLNMNIEQFMDDTLPEDMLGRLERAVWAVQARTLSTILATHLGQMDSGLDPAPLDQKDAQKEQMKKMEQSSWKLGKSCAETRWRPLAIRGDQDLKGALLALYDTPFAGYPYGNAFLVKRAVNTGIEIQLKSCPHLSNYSEVHSIADDLCNLHTHWMRGFTSTLNNKIKIEHLQQSKHCFQQWSLSE